MDGSENSGYPNASLMLKIRADALRSNLVKVQNFLASAPNRKVPLLELEDALKKLKALANEIDVTVYSVKSDLEDEIREEIPISLSELQQRATEFQERLNSLFEKIKGLRAATKEARNNMEGMLVKVQEMKRGCFGIEPKEPAAPVITDDLKKRTNEPLKALAFVTKSLGAMVPDAQAWHKYYYDAAIPSQAIFADYVDFLGGMALRDIGFDEGISRVAEDLIRTYKTNREPLFPWLALPGGRRGCLL